MSMHGIAVLLHADGTVARKLDQAQMLQAIYELADACADELRLAAPQICEAQAHRLMLRAHLVSYLNGNGKQAAIDVLRDLLVEMSKPASSGQSDPTDWDSVAIK